MSFELQSHRSSNDANTWSKDQTTIWLDKSGPRGASNQPRGWLNKEVVGQKHEVVDHECSRLAKKQPLWNMVGQLESGQPQGQEMTNKECDWPTRKWLASLKKWLVKNVVSKLGNYQPRMWSTRKKMIDQEMAS